MLIRTLICLVVLNSPINLKPTITSCKVAPDMFRDQVIWKYAMLERVTKHWQQESLHK